MNTQEEKNTLKEQEIIEEVEQKPEASSPLVERELANCRQSVTEWQEKAARLAADFENYKKRMVKEQAGWIQSARIALLSNLLNVTDNFDRAMEHKKTMQMDGAGMKEWSDGIAMIHAAFQEFLKKAGVQEVPYDVFDPVYHEALMHVASDKHTTGDIVEVLEKGYLMGEHVLRPAKVSVAK